MPCKFSNRLATAAFIATSWLALVSATGCTTPATPAAALDSALLKKPVAPSSAATTPVQVAPATPQPASTEPHADTHAAVVTRMLAYADRLRSLSPPELSAELARLADARTPADQMQLALALAQLRQTPELIRAQDLLTRLLANASPESTALHPLARLLAQRFGEQRRFEDLLDKQSQQTRDTQRRLDQTTERLEALKAIERSLGGRAPASNNAAPANGTPAPAIRPRSAP